MSTLTVKGVNGTVTFDGQMVTITRSGFLARATIGKGEKRFPLSSLTAVQWKPAGPVVSGYISFTMGGAVERTSAFGKATFDATKDENTVVFYNKQQPEFEKFRDTVERAIADRHRPAAAAPAAPAQPDVMAQLKQLGELRDAGVLTDAEFQAKKTDLLGRL